MHEPLVVAERFALVRECLVALLTAKVSGQAESGVTQPARGAATLAEAEAIMERETRGVLLLDLSLVDDLAGASSGLQSICTRFPGWHVVALSERETRECVVQCLAAGAHGAVAKTAGAAELLRAVTVVGRGGVHVPDVLAAPRIPQVAPGPQTVSQLTERQRDVLRLMAEGRSTKDIARTLDLAVSTIKVHLAAVYRTVGARNRVEALCRAGLLPRDPLVS